MGHTSAGYLKERFKFARLRLLENRPLMANASDSSVCVHALNKGEIDALEAVGLKILPWEKGAERDPLIRSIRDYMALIETSFTASEAATQLKVTVSSILRRVREGGLLGVDYEGRKRLPRFQFEHGRAIPGLRDVLAELSGGLNPLDVAQWFLSPNSDLEVEDRSFEPAGVVTLGVASCCSGGVGAGLELTGSWGGWRPDYGKNV